MFERAQCPVGFVNLQVSVQNRIADWGFYAAPEAPRGTGRGLGHATLHYAFDVLQVHKLTGQVLTYNHKSIRFHQALGFRQEGLLREQHLDHLGIYHDVMCFGLLRAEWQDPSNDPASGHERSAP